LVWICSRVKGGRVLLRPDGSPISEGEIADQENHRVAQVPASWRSLVSTTV